MEGLKSEHKAFLVLLKYIPFVLSFLCFFCILFDILGVNSMWLSTLSGAGFIPCIFILIASVIFKYCLYHRVPLYYVMLNNLANWLIYSHNFDVNMCNYISWFMIITAIFCIITTILYLKRKEQHVIATNNKGTIVTSN